MVISLQENNHIQNYLDLPEPTLQKKITCACNVGPQSANNFTEENNLQFWLDLYIYKEITCGMLVHNVG